MSQPPILTNRILAELADVGPGTAVELELELGVAREIISGCLRDLLRSNRVERDRVRFPGNSVPSYIYRLPEHSSARSGRETAAA